MKKLESILTAGFLKLKSHYEEYDKESDSLIGKIRFCYISIKLDKVYNPEYNKVQNLKLPHSLFENESICLIIPNKFDLSKLAPDLVTSIIEFDDLRKRLKNKLEKDKLINSYDYFLADRKIIDAIPAMFGKSMMRAGKLPYKFRLSKNSSFKQALNDSLTKTHLAIRQSQTFNIKLGGIMHDTKKLTDNSISVLRQIYDYFTKQDYMVNEVTIHYSGSPKVLIMKRDI